MEISLTSRKRLFIGLIFGTSLLVCVGLALLWIVPYVGFAGHAWAAIVWGIVVAVSIVVVLWANMGLAASVLTGRTLPLTRKLRGVTIKLFLPLMILFARLIGISKERVRNSFIKVNNELVLAEAKAYAPSEILLLLPHCLQSSICTVRLTYNVGNCKRCGLCPMAGLLALSESYGVHMAVATGGTIARRIVVQKRPKLILAVACERDLSSGIQDTYPIPVFGVLNQRPKGPCLDTCVPLEEMEAALRHFLALCPPKKVIIPALRPSPTGAE
jgi:hypothetical protein